MKKQIICSTKQECYKTFSGELIDYDDIVDMFEEANEINPNSFDNVEEYIDYMEMTPFIYYFFKVDKYNENGEYIDDTTYYINEKVNNNGTSTYYIYNDYNIMLYGGELYATNEWDDAIQYIANTENVILCYPFNNDECYYPQDNNDDNE